MGRLLPTFTDVPSHRYTVSLDDVQFRVRLTFRRRLRAWYMDLFKLDETPIAQGRRLEPTFGPLVGLSPIDGPDGEFYVRGAPKPYTREEFGDAVRLAYYTVAEVTPPAVASPLLIEVQP